VHSMNNYQNNVNILPKEHSERFGTQWFLKLISFWEKWSSKWKEKYIFF
jgi:hypothetical protein